MKIKELKLEGTVTDAVLGMLKELHDPYIVDIRDREELWFKIMYKRDYLWLKELSNKGITEIHFRAKIAGTMKLRRVLDKLKFFDRELVILYSDDQHLKAVKRIINGDRDRKGNAENGEGSKNTLQSRINQ